MLAIGGLQAIATLLLSRLREPGYAADQSTQATERRLHAIVLQPASRCDVRQHRRLRVLVLGVVALVPFSRQPARELPQNV